MRKRPTIGVLAGGQVYYGTILGNFIGPLLEGACAAAQRHGCNLLLACGMEHSTIAARPAWPVLAPDADFVPVGPWNTDGLIVINPLLSDARANDIAQISAAGHPVVFIANGGAGPTVTVDNAGGVDQALRHLVAHGHQRIAFIAGRPDDLDGDSGIRLRAYQSAVQTYGLAADPRLVAYGYHGIDGGHSAMRQILDAGVAFTALLASNDESSIGAMAALRATGLRIPQDVAVVGFDDSLEAAAQAPPLTTLHSSPFEMGVQALELLVALIAGRQLTQLTVQVPMRLVIRQSCGCQPASARRPLLDTTQPTSVLTSPAQQVARSMTEVVMAEAQRLSVAAVEQLCQRLVVAFVASVEQDDPAGFTAELEAVLDAVALADDDIHVWQAALLTLNHGAVALQAATEQRIGERLRLAQIVVSERVRRQYRRYVANQRWIIDRMDLLNARLLTALDEAQIFAILAEHLPQMGIERMEVVFFEGSDADPQAWSRLHPVPERERQNWQFPTRQFPPAGLYDEPLSLALLPLANQGERAGYVVFETSKLELCAAIVWQLLTFLKVVRLYREATHGRQLAEEANRLKSRLLSTVSHELRTPLGLIVGLSNLLLQDEPHQQDAARRLDLTRIHASAQHLDGLIRDVLDLSQSEIAQLKLALEPIDIAEALATVVAVGEQLASDKGLAWHAEIPSGLPTILADRTRLRQVALNLVSNAVKFTERGSVTLRVSAAEQLLMVAVIDTGLGIPLAEQALIFDEFRQSERTAARGYGGLGLGLAVCKRLVELHGGTIGVHSFGDEGAGSTFYFTLPLEPLPAEQHQRSPLVPGQTVLLLADESTTGAQVRQYLQQQGFLVETLALGHAGWPAHMLDAPPGAVILERRRASAQGWELLKVLREHPLTATIPVLFYSLEVNGGALLDLDYLAKPMAMAELARALERQGLTATQDAEPKSILIVDDEPGTLELHARIVNSWSPRCRIRKAHNGREAVELIRREHPDLILLDLMMPELDGFGVLEQMQRDASSRDIPVIVLTGQILTQADMLRLNRGVTNILKKGLFSAEETLAHINAALVRSKHLGSETQRLVRKAMAHIHEHYGEPISLTQIATAIGISKEYLARCFHQETGMTLVTYLNRYRIDQAKACIAAGETNLSDIALKVGFASEPYFSRVFRQEVGMSPSEYRRNRF